MKNKYGTFRKTGTEWTDLKGLQTATSFGSEVVSTDYAAGYIGGSVDAVGKRLHRLANLGYVVRKKINKAEGRQVRYGWRLSAKGVKEIGW